MVSFIIQLVLLYIMRVCVADKGNYCFTAFQIDGQFHFRVIQHLNSPYDVTVKMNNQLIVTDHGDHCIYTFTLDGHYINRFGTQGQLRQPCSITTDHNYTIVTDTGHHRIVIFDSDGNCVHCFGPKGVDSSHFDHPRGVAISPNGSIYVSDSLNHRVQIFSQ